MGVGVTHLNYSVRSNFAGRLDLLTFRVETLVMTKDSPTSTYDQVWQLIADLRDGDTRHPEDTPTSDIVDALIDAGYLKVAK